MRELTFLGYLSGYVRKLSRYDTNSISKLAEDACNNNYRLREPLALFALYSDKAELLVRATKDEVLSKEYAKFFATYNVNSVELAFLNHSNDLSEEYHKVWNSYQCRKNRMKRDERVKLKAFDQVRAEKIAKGISNYRIYTDLHLNPGNLNAWLKSGDPSKVSVDTAVEVLRYLRESCSA